VSDPALLATDLADYLVAKGVPFRAAHHAVGAVVNSPRRTALRLDQLPLEEVQKDQRGVRPPTGPACSIWDAPWQTRGHGHARAGADERTVRALANERRKPVGRSG